MLVKFAALFGVTQAGLGWNREKNALAETPPMGWRSWNAYHDKVTQAKMEAVMDKMVDRSRKVDGVGTSLLDLGFDNCGLDDNWQACGTGTKGTFYDGVTGRPLVNLTTFPSLKGMAAHGHKAGLNVGWYLNTCICGVGPGTFDGNQVRPNAAHRPSAIDRPSPPQTVAPVRWIPVPLPPADPGIDRPLRPAPS